MSEAGWPPGQGDAGPTAGSPGDLAFLQDWACALAEQLPFADVRRLSRAASAGESGLRQFRAEAPSAIVRDACDQVLRRLVHASPEYVAGLLSGAAFAVERARRRESVQVAWTGPESAVTSSRLTAAAVVDLIDSARSEILLVSYATQTEPTMRSALAAAAGRGVHVTLLIERHADNPSYTPAVTPFPSLQALRLSWPASARRPGAALHAKIIVVDDQVALVGSANLTSRAMEDNLECGILLRGGPHPKAIRAHITSLHESGTLRRVHG